MKYLFSHFNWPCPSPCTTVGWIPKITNFSKQPVFTRGLVELWHTFLHPCSMGTLTAVGRETYQFVARMLFRCSCFHDPLTLRSLWCNNPLPQKLSCAQSMHEPGRGPHPLPALTSAGGQHPPLMPGNVSHPGQPSDSRTTMAQPSCQQPRRTCHTFNCSICHRSSCKFLHLYEICGANHSAWLSPNKDNSVF